MNQTRPTLCPLCLPAVKSPLVQKPGVFYTFCQSPGGGEGPHKWADMEQVRTAVQWGKSRFPAEYGNDAPPKSDVVVKGPLTISETTKEFIEKQVKTFITSESDLKGIIFTYTATAEEDAETIKQLRAELAAAQRQRPSGVPGRAPAIAGNQVILTIPEWAEGIVEEQAGSEGKTRAEWVNEQYGAWLETYFQQVPIR